jgi:AraC-like DNA-binding protein
MDVLGDWLRDVGTTGILLARSKFAAPWGIAIPGIANGGDCMFHVVTEGSCWLRVHGNVMELRRGDYVLLPNGDPHDLLHAPDGTAEPIDDFLARVPGHGVAADGAIICGAYRGHNHGKPLPLIRSLPAVVYFPAEEIRVDASLSAVLDLLTAEVETPGVGGEALLPTLFDALLLYTLRAWGRRSCETTRNRWMAALQDPQLAASLQRMHGEPGNPWTVESLARCAGLSRAAFARRFAQVLGEPPLSYLTALRMRLAARRFAAGGESMSEVARQLGYDSEFAFSRAFKREWGVAPRAYRKQVAG